MFFSALYFPLNKNIKSDNDVISSNLMIRSNMVHKLSSGVYIWLPFGLIVLRKLENLIRKEMNNVGYLEIFMPALQPEYLWKFTGRWEKFGNELFKLIDRNDKSYCLGPTHEEVVCSILKDKINSYKEFPIKFFQIQTKFRDEIRPRYGVIRSKEFLMKDAYSFHTNKNCFDRSYSDMYNSYSNILNKLSLNFNVVAADAGKIGNLKSEEFHVISDTGEDKFVYSSGKKYFSSFEIAARKIKTLDLVNFDCIDMLELVDTPNVKTTNEVSKYFKVDRKEVLKTILMKGVNDLGIVMVLLRGDHEINFFKLLKCESVKKPLEFLDETSIFNLFGCEPGFVGPIGIKNLSIIADYDVLNMINFICGSNITGKHYKNVNWEINCLKPKNLYDIRNVCAGDESPLGDGPLLIKKGIEVGHIFELGNRYTLDLSVNYCDINGKTKPIFMGCYGIGISRLVAAVIEQFNDNNGIIWPMPIAPYMFVIVPIDFKKFSYIRDISLKIYRKFLSLNIDCLYYDKDDRLSVIFKNIDLMGIPHRIVINSNTIKNNKFEYKRRNSKNIEYLDEDQIFNLII